MKTKAKPKLLILLTFLMILSFSGCSSHPMTTKEMFEIQDKYERGKISDKEYLEYLDAYNNNEPKPKKGIIGFFANLIEKIVYVIITAFVILFLILAFRKKK